MSAASPQPLTVYLSGPVADFVREQVATEGFSDASEYINRLVFERQRQKALASLEAQLLEGLDSPDLEVAVLDGLRSQPKHVADEAFWESIDRAADEILKQRESA